MDELQKVVADTIKDKVNWKEPPSIISTTTSGQLQMQIVDTSGIVDTIVQQPSTEGDKDTTIEQTWQIGTFDPTAQPQGVPPQIFIIDQGSR